MDRMDFTQSVTRIRVMEKKLLDSVTIDKLVDAKDLDDVLRILQDTEYADAISKISDKKDTEKILSYELNKSFKEMQELSPDESIIDLLKLKYDYHNLKVMLKEYFMNSDLSKMYIPIGTVDFEKLKAFFLSSDYKNIPEKFREAINTVVKDYEEKKDPQRIDIILDKFYFEDLYDLAIKTEIEMIVNYVKDNIDFINILTALRLKKLDKDIQFLRDILIENGNIDPEEIAIIYLESPDNMVMKFKNSRISKWLKNGLETYNSSGRISAFEKSMDNHLINLIKESKTVVFGPEPIFAYLVAKEMEIKVLRIIMVSKLNNISPQAIRERLRELYV
ncbi:MAG: V-type ATP synthase subunit C [Tissierellales bacterium]|nr:V-type ATP synthase subunit C [Tissierellales bacterium]